MSDKKQALPRAVMLAFLIDHYGEPVLKPILLFWAEIFLFGCLRDGRREYLTYPQGKRAKTTTKISQPKKAK